MADHQRAEVYSYADYLSWPEGERMELIDGVAYAMSPSPQRVHQRLAGELYRQIANVVRGTPCEVYPAPFDVKLSTAEADDAATVVQPDIVVVCDPAKLTVQGMTGAPDLVVEIVSPSSGYHDRGRKFDLYRDNGVGEYWIVDPDESVVEVYRLDADGAYLRSGVFGPGEQVAARCNDRIVVDLSEVFG